MASSDTPSITSCFQETISKLETSIDRMEGGELSLEESLHIFENGITLVRSAQEQLSKAEQRVQLISSKDDFPAGDAITTPAGKK